MYLDTVWPSKVVPRGGTLGNHQLEAGHMGKLMRRNYLEYRDRLMRKKYKDHTNWRSKLFRL